MASGSWTFFSENPRVEGRVTWSSTSNGSTANTSNVRFELHLRRTNTGFTTQGTPNISVRFDGTQVSTSANRAVLTSPTWVLVHSFNRNVTHNNNGSKRLGIQVVSTNSTVDGFRFNSSRDVDLVNIPRFAAVNSWSNTSRTHNSATFSWSADSSVSRVICRFGGANGTQRFDSGTINATSGTFTVTGLTENTTYNNCMITITRRDSGLTTNSGNISFTTNFQAPTSNFTIGTRTINSIALSWSSNFACDEVRVFRGGTECFVSTGLNVSSGNITLLPTHGIAPGTSYSLTVRVRRRASQVSVTSAAQTATTLTLPTIANTTPVSFNIGNSISVGMENRNNQFTLQFQRRLADGTWTTMHTTTASTNASISITPDANVLFNQTVNTRTLQCRIVTSTTLNNTTYTLYNNGIHHLTANVVNSNPTFEGFTLHSNPNFASINNLIGGTTNMISGEGGMRLVFDEDSAIALNSANLVNLTYRVEFSDANITSGSITYDTSAFDFDIPTANILFRTAGRYTVFIRAVDSRGNMSSETSRTFTVFPYHRPTITATLTRFNNFESWVSLNLNATISRLTVSSVQQNEILRIEYRSAEVSEVFPSTFEQLTGFTTTNGVNDDQRASRNIEAGATSGFLSFESNKSYNVQFRIADSLHTSSIFTVNVAQGVPLFSVFENGKTAVNTVPDLSDDAPTLQVGGDVKIDGTAHFRGNHSGSWVNAIRNAAIKVISRNMQDASNATIALALKSVTGWFVIGQHNQSNSDANERFSFGFINHDDYNERNNVFTAAFNILRNGAMSFSNLARNAIWLLMHPVGTIYFTTVSTNPGTIYGGTWEQWGQGRVPIGMGSNGTTDYQTVGATGGAETHILTVAQMPVHTHTQNAHTHTQNAHRHRIAAPGAVAPDGFWISTPQHQAGTSLIAGTTTQTGSHGRRLERQFDCDAQTATNQNTTATNQNTGSGNAHNNMQPWITCFMWRRTA